MSTLSAMPRRAALPRLNVLSGHRLGRVEARVFAPSAIQSARSYHLLARRLSCARAQPDVETVGVVVPTYNSARTIAACLASLRAQTTRCQIVVVDNHSIDETVAIAKPLVDHLLIWGPERSAQRNAGAALLTCDLIGFIDSDMTLAPAVVSEVVTAVQSGAVAVVVPERTIGRGFWATVRAFERAFYVGDPNIEAARFFNRDVFVHLGGFDETLTGSEDWDLDRRARALGALGRTTSQIEHLEDGLTFREACRKKAYYAPGFRAFSSKHGRAAVLQALNRRYVRQPWRLLYPHPLLGLGLLALKGGEITMMVRALAQVSGPARSERRGRDL